MAGDSPSVAMTGYAIVILNELWNFYAGVFTKIVLAKKLFSANDSGLQYSVDRKVLQQPDSGLKPENSRFPIFPVMTGGYSRKICHSGENQKMNIFCLFNKTGNPESPICTVKREVFDLLIVHEILNTHRVKLKLCESPG